MLHLPFGDQLCHEKAGTIVRNKVLKMHKVVIKVLKRNGTAAWPGNMKYEEEIEGLAP